MDHQYQQSAYTNRQQLKKTTSQQYLTGKYMKHKRSQMNVGAANSSNGLNRQSATQLDKKDFVKDLRKDF